MVEQSVNRVAAEAIEISLPVIMGNQQEKSDDQDRVDDVAYHSGKESDGPDDDQNDGDGGEHEVFEAAVKFEQDGMFCACRAKARTPRSAPKMEPCFASFPL